MICSPSLYSSLSPHTNVELLVAPCEKDIQSSLGSLLSSMLVMERIYSVGNKHYCNLGREKGKL